ncbi:MAG: glycosyltransferase family 2 protein [Clostridia bacterium]|nr:glycosyltransferase family 2 protein [Clostridia bacterium]
MNTENVKVSVIIPIYNAADYIRPAIDSVLAQTLSEFEIICVDDGSTDSTLEVLREYQKIDSRVRIVTETNAGPAYARNNGMRRARGEYVAFLDADDFFEPEMLRRLYELASDGDLDIAIANFDVYNNKKGKFENPNAAENADIFDGGRISSKNEYPDRILTSTVGAAWNKLFRRSFVEEKGLSFLADVHIYEDVYFVTTALSLAERVGRASEILVHHRIHSDQSRKKAVKKYYAEVPPVYLKIKDFLTSHGMYAPLSRSYLNLSAGRCYKMFNLLSGDAQSRLWDMLHEEYAELFSWQDAEELDFELKEVYEFTVFVQVFTHAEFKKRTKHGRKPRIVNPKQNIEFVKQRRRFRTLLGGIFKKK